MLDHLFTQQIPYIVYFCSVLYVGKSLNHIANTFLLHDSTATAENLDVHAVHLQLTKIKGLGKSMRSKINVTR